MLRLRRTSLEKKTMQCFSIIMLDLPPSLPGQYVTIRSVIIGCKYFALHFWDRARSDERWWRLVIRAAAPGVKELLRNSQRFQRLARCPCWRGNKEQTLGAILITSAGGRWRPHTPPLSSPPAVVLLLLNNGGKRGSSLAVELSRLSVSHLCCMRGGRRLGRWGLKVLMSGALSQV